MAVLTIKTAKNEGQNPAKSNPYNCIESIVVTTPYLKYSINIVQRILDIQLFLCALF